MTRLAITGPESLNHDEAKVVVLALNALLAPEADDEFTSGAANGVDTIGVLMAHAAGYHVRLTIPIGRLFNFSLEVESVTYGWEVIKVPGGYMKRNDKTIEFCDRLLAFPETSSEELRSGTWATVRRARKAGCSIRVTPLDRSEPWEEGIR